MYNRIKLRHKCNVNFNGVIFLRIMKKQKEQNEYVSHLSRIISFPHYYIFIQLTLDIIISSKFQVQLK